MVYCQVVVGSPGAGKTTYCYAMQQFMKAIGREAIIVNLDPANEDLKYECSVNVTDFITVEDVMNEYHLGPNGSLIYCMEWLEKNFHVLKDRLDQVVYKSNGDSVYVLFDFPGQAELYTHNTSICGIIKQLQSWEYNPVAVHLADSHLCLDPSNFVSALMMSLAVMFHMELPHVNVLTKVDLLETYGELPFNIDFYTQVLDLHWLMEHIDPHLELENQEDREYAELMKGYESDDDEEGVVSPKPHAPSPHKQTTTLPKQELTEEQREALEEYRTGHRRLNTAIADLIEDYSLVSFYPLSVNDKYQMHKVLSAIDKANGYMFANLDLANVELEKYKASIEQDTSKLEVKERKHK